MGFEVQTQTIHFNSSYTFTFANPIQQYVAGISGFCISYGGGNYFGVQTMSVGLNVIGMSGNMITVKPIILMWDGGGSQGGDSTVTVTVVAYTGATNNPNLLLITDTQNNPIALPSTPLTTIPVLNGFSLSYADNVAHYVSYLQAGIGLIQNGNNMSVTGHGCMFDSTNHYANPATVNGGLIVNCDPSLTTLTAQSFVGIDNGASFNFPCQALFLTGFFYFFQDNQISEIVASVSLNDNTITCTTTVWYGTGTCYTGGTVDFVAINFPD